MTLISYLCRNEQKKLTTYLNPYSYMLARNNVDIFKHFNLHIDGFLLVLFLKILRIGRPVRKSFDMTSMAPILFEEAIKNNKSIYFIGSDKLSIEKAIVNIKNNFSKLNIVGFSDGYSSDDFKDKIELINTLNPDIVVCGMGTPLQEKFLLKLQNKSWKGEGYTCGGFLHQTSNKIDYYPKLINKFNLRWLYRLLDEPKKIAPRLIKEYLVFSVYIIYDYIKFRFDLNKSLR